MIDEVSDRLEDNQVNGEMKSDPTDAQKLEFLRKIVSDDSFPLKASKRQKTNDNKVNIDSGTNSGSEEPKRKRLACYNCRKRRKKCTLDYPCANCKRLELVCNINEQDLRKKRYTTSYVTSLEEHIANLETSMRNLVESFAPGNKDEILDSMKLGDIIREASPISRQSSPDLKREEAPKVNNKVPVLGTFRDNLSQAGSTVKPQSLEKPNSSTEKPRKSFVKGSIYMDSTNKTGRLTQPNSSLSVSSLLSSSRSSTGLSGELKERISDLKTTVIVRNNDTKSSSRNLLTSDYKIIKSLSNFYKWLYPGHFIFVHRESFLYGFFAHAENNYKNSQYCSEELVYSMCAIGSRLSPELRDLSEVYYEKSKKALLEIVFDEQSVATITTVQALFCLAFYELGKGNMQMAWYFSGLAIRVGYAMGFQLDPKVWHVDDDSDENLTQSELEIRSRIYWGCYIADHFICLMLGRNSTLSVSNSTIPESDELPEVEGTEEFSFVGRHVLQISLPLKNLIVLSRIVQVFTSKIFIESDNMESKVHFLRGFNVQVECWKQSLPEFLQWNDETLKDKDITTDPTISYFWYYYYIVLMTFNKPFVRQSEEFLSLIETLVGQLEILLGNFQSKMGGFKKATLFQLYACLLASTCLKSFLEQTLSPYKNVQYKKQKSFFDNILKNELSETYELALAVQEDQEIDQFNFDMGPSLYPLNQVNNDVTYTHDFSLSNEIDDIIRDFFSVEQIDLMGSGPQDPQVPFNNPVDIPIHPPINPPINPPMSHPIAHNIALNPQMNDISTLTTGSTITPTPVPSVSVTQSRDISRDNSRNPSSAPSRENTVSAYDPVPTPPKFAHLARATPKVKNKKHTGTLFMHTKR
ncbi:TY1 enhancer activator [Nakaseomyces bracarensis]|uniref:TY1 enhancer activator n=1 Tax=Nakaseomyces bracarensis TaxID=273131 RepID=A0ABR4NNX3_9SACH